MFFLFVVVLSTTSFIPYIKDLGMGYVAMAFGIIMLIKVKSSADKQYAALDWDLLFFFATLFIVINLAAALGALGFGYLQDRIGSRRVIQATLLIWIVAVVGAAAAPNKMWFWVVGMLVGVAIGSTQSASRALVGLFSPESRSGEFLGFWGSFGKLSGVISIPLFGVLAEYAGPGELKVAARRVRDR